MGVESMNFRRVFGHGTYDPRSSADVRIKRRDLLREATVSIVSVGMTDEETETFLNCLVRDLLPDRYLSKVRKVGVPSA